LQTLLECHYRSSRRTRRHTAQKANNSPPLLRADSERPHCRSPNSTEKFPSPHFPHPKAQKARIVPVHAYVLEARDKLKLKLMSALGQKRTFAPQKAFSALPPKQTFMLSFRCQLRTTTELSNIVRACILRHHFVLTGE
jgi:hypothetical protein